MNLVYSRHLSAGGGGDGESFQEVCKEKENTQFDIQKQEFVARPWPCNSSSYLEKEL